MLLGTIIALLAGGLIGFWIGARRATSAVNSEWMRALEQAKLDGIVDEQQRSDIIRIQDSERQS